MTSQVHKKLARHEVWRQQYRSRRYLQNATDEALATRFRDIFGNLLTLTNDGKIGILPVGPDGEYWMVLFTHVLEEYVIRGRGVPQISDFTMPSPTSPHAPKSMKAVKKAKELESRTVLVKLGKKTHMQGMYNHGRIRISPASSYSDPSLNRAIQDDELGLDSFVPGSEVTITLLDQTTLAPTTSTKPLGDVTRSLRLATDYYVYCMTHTLEHRLFSDFSATACVIVHDAQQFQKRMWHEVSMRLPGWIDWEQSVKYFDPYLSSSDEVDLFCTKHFRYWYQKEYRFVWIPPTKSKNTLKPFDVQLGSLSDIAELFIL